MPGMDGGTKRKIGKRVAEIAEKRKCPKCEKKSAMITQGDKKYICRWCGWVKIDPPLEVKKGEVFEI